MPSRIIQILTLALVTSTACADAIKAYLGDEVARFSYASESVGQQFGRLETEFGILFTDRDELIRDDDYLLHLGFQVRGESLDIPLIATIGSRLYYGEASTYDVAGIAIGGELLLLPESWGGFGLGAFLYHAPEVVSFRDAEQITEWGVFASFQITPQASLVGGFQNIEAKIQNLPGEVEVEDDVYFGLDMRF